MIRHRPFLAHRIRRAHERARVVDAQDVLEATFRELEGRAADCAADVEGEGVLALACEVLESSAMALDQQRTALAEVHGALSCRQAVLVS